MRRFKAFFDYKTKKISEEKGFLWFSGKTSLLFILQTSDFLCLQKFVKNKFSKASKTFYQRGFYTFL